MKSKTETIALYAERFVELVKTASTEKDRTTNSKNEKLQEQN